MRANEPAGEFRSTRSRYSLRTVGEHAVNAAGFDIRSTGGRMRVLRAQSVVHREDAEIGEQRDPGRVAPVGTQRPYAVAATVEVDDDACRRSSGKTVKVP